MVTLLDQIPEIRINPEAGGDGSSARPLASRPKAAGTVGSSIRASTLERRSFLRAAVVGGGALAVSMLGWVSERVPAFAARGDRVTLSPTHCIGQNQPGDTPCWGRTYIASRFCGSDGRHRIDTVNTTHYSLLYSWEAACAGYAGWFWNHSGGGRTNCWDGFYYERNNTTGHKSGPYTSCCQKRV